MFTGLLKMLQFGFIGLVVAFATSFAPMTAVQAANNNQNQPNGNNGTLKVHEFGTPSGTESNDPKVCVFNFEGFGFDTSQSGYIVIQEQPGSQEYGPYAFGPTDMQGYAQTEYFNDQNGPTVPNGHYKATLYGKKNGTIDLKDEKAKSKVFKINCAPAPLNPTVTVKTGPCAIGNLKTGFAIITVSNPNEGAGDATYSVTVHGITKNTGVLHDGASQNLLFIGLAAGTYDVTVEGSDHTLATASFTIDTCVFPKKPEVTVTPGPCIDARSTDGTLIVEIKNRNNYNATYTVTVGGTVQQVNINANSTEVVIFTGLGVGTHLVVVKGSDHTLNIEVAKIKKCPVIPQAPTVEVIAGPCVEKGQNGTLTVRVTNPNSSNVTYHVSVDGTTQQVIVAANSAEEVVFMLPDGTYPVEVVGSDDTNAVAQGTLTLCPGQGAGPQQPTPSDPPAPIVPTPVTPVITLPATLPATGPSDSPLGLLLTLLASSLTYVVARKMQRRPIQTTANNL